MSRACIYIYVIHNKEENDLHKFSSGKLFLENQSAYLQMFQTFQQVPRVIYSCVLRIHITHIL